MDNHVNPPFPLRRANRSLALKLGAVSLAMFGFGFALVPLYNVFCKATGLNGRTADGALPAVRIEAVADPRWITVEFNTDVMPGLPWRFEPRQRALRVHPGEMATAWFHVKNLSDRPMVGRAIPSVSPPLAARHFRKIECFCFTRQALKPGEERDMPVTFVVNRYLPPEVTVFTLSYAFFPNQGTALALGGRS